jgi:hypothetical protein
MTSLTGTTTVALATTLRTTYTTPLLAAIQQGTTIQASHLNSIADFINDVRNHDHTLTDFTSIKEFGNFTTGTVSTNRTTSISDISAVTAPATVGVSITAAHYTTLQVGANDAHQHRHTFSDDIP